MVRMRGYWKVLTSKPEGGRFWRGGGEDGLQRSMRFGAEDPDADGSGRGEDLGGKQDRLRIHSLFGFIQGLRL